MTRSLLLTLAFAMLAGCADYGLGSIGGYGDRYPDTRRYPDNRRADDRYDDYSRTSEYRRISSDAADYARRVDDQLRIGSGQERRIRDLLTDRTARLLQQTRARDHGAVYPFPRRYSGDSRAARTFWSQADRDIERILGRRDAEAYRYYVRDGGRHDNRRYDDGTYGRQDTRRNNGRANRTEQGRNDGERGRADQNRNNRGSNGRADRDDRNTREARRPNETLEEWYRRQAARRQSDDD